MLDQVLSLFNIKPDIDLNLMEENQQLHSFTSNALRSLYQVIDKINPDLVLIQGDTTTAMTSAIAAFYKRILIGHVEAGLRTYDTYRPFPEEANRRIISILASYHFAPTRRSKIALLKEGVRENSVFLTGNTVIDALIQVLEKIRIENYIPANFPSSFTQNHHKLILLTSHRRENFGIPLKNICEAILSIVQRNPKIHILYPVHLNPNVKEIVYSALSNHERIHLVPPLNYKDLCFFMDRSHVILTDSGGLQEEAPTLGKPVLVLREVTERPEGVEAGIAKVVGTQTDRIIIETERLLSDEAEYRRMAKRSNPYGDGHAAERIVKTILKSIA
jgi:UDP-N-acetylglucosamine 2-epimerase